MINNTEKKYEELLEQHNKLKCEFNCYQNFMEKNIQELNDKNLKLGKKLDILSNVIEISKYINSMISDNNLLAMMNDIIIGIIGVKYSSFLLKENGKLVVKVTNMPDISLKQFELGCHEFLNEREPFINNSEENNLAYNSCKEDIHSVMGVPIFIKDNLLGYILIEHTVYNFFNNEHMKFVTAIANQMGIALENNTLYNKIRESSIRDPLLGIYNRKYFFDQVERMINLYHDDPFAIVMIDLDNFKRVNDVYGHQYGDEVLIRTSNIINDNIDEKSIFARYGGEELIIYINNFKNKKEVYNKVDDLREKVSKNIIKYGDISSSITASFGISSYPESGYTLEKVINKADYALYAAKKSGKNKVISDLE